MSPRHEYPTAKELTLKLGGRWNDRMRRGNGCCPAHDDHDPSLDIVEKDGKLLFICRTGCSQDAVIAALRAQGLWPEPSSKANGQAKAQKQIVAIYTYTDADGVPRFQAVRFRPKEFRQRRSDPSRPDGWVWNLPLEPQHRFLPYRLVEVQEAISLDQPVVALEGEKDCDNCRTKLGITATTNAGGAGKWRAEHAAYLKGADIIIVADNDDAGRRHAEQVAASLVGISEREFAEVSADVAEEPGQLAGVDPAVDLEILAPEGRYAGDDRWARLMRVEGRSDLFLHGAFKGFRNGAIFDTVLKDQVLTGFFGFDRADQFWRTFMPPKLNDTVDRPHLKRELYIRPTWVARQISPSSFPEFRDGPVINPAAQAKYISKLGQNKAATKRAQHAANHVRIRAEAEARRVLREQDADSGVA